MAEDDQGQDHELGSVWPVDVRLVDGMSRAAQAEYVPAARAELHAWLAAGPGPRALRPGHGRARLERARAARELAAAGLVHVGEHLAEAVTDATPLLPRWYRTRAEDVPAQPTFVVYARPPIVAGAPVRAMLWSPRRGGWAVMLWGEHMLEEVAPGGQRPNELLRTPARLVDIDAVPSPAQRPAESGSPDAEKGEAVRLAMATWLILAQHHAVNTTEVRGTRSVRRAIAVGGMLPPETKVHAVELRRLPADNEHRDVRNGPGPRGWWRPQRAPEAQVAARRPWWVVNHQR